MTDSTRIVSGFWLRLGAAWTIALALGAWWIRSNPRPPAPPVSAAAGCLPADQRTRLPGFTARRTLAKAHWIGPGDLDWATPGAGVLPGAVLWQYASCPVQAGERLAAQETRPLPAVAVPDGRTAQVLPLGTDPRVSAVVNAGSTIDAWRGGTAVARGLPVLAVQCPHGRFPPVDGCTAIVAASSDEAIRLRTVTQAAVEIVVVATP